MQNIWNYSFNAPDLVDMKPEEIKVRSFAEGLKILYQIYKTTREHLTNKGQDNEDGVFTVNVSAISKSFNKPKEQKDALNLKTLEEALSSDALSKKNPIVFDAENSSAAIKL
ncbi:MAG: hypothetical protein HWD61_02800 [Parachlamydiaceae bacterium]|nr:MAG: hypothetical protein HWD61_02800 [Parachlamydiaceae bacterium]